MIVLPRFLVIVLCVGAAMLWASSALHAQSLGRYHDYSETTAFLQDYAAMYPNLLEVGSLGQSVQGREIWYARITDNLGLQEDEPEFRYISTMHGNEPVGTEMSLYFIDHLLSNYGSDTKITNLIDDTDITIVPSMNPDGLEVDIRWNAEGYDLNRSFPDGAVENIGNLLDGPPMDTAGRPPEVTAVMEWGAANRFTLSANFHTGALVVNYPFDNDGQGSTFSPSPDEELFAYVSEQYSIHNEPMWNSPYFYHGVVNGAEWYSLEGGMQDWSYRYLGDNHVTIELSDTFRPRRSKLPGLWDDNRDAMLAYMEQVHIGVRGLMTDSVTGLPVEGTVQVVDNEHLIFSDPDIGDYHRMLLPGTYDLTFTALGYEPVTIEDVVVAEGDAVRVDVSMQAIVEYLQADFDEDGDVDGADFLAWQTGFGIQSNATHHDGDADSNMAVDGNDLLVWQGQFSSVEAQLSGNAAVPEPSAALLLLASVLLSLRSVGCVQRSETHQT